jgi:L-lactate permease
MKELDLLKKEWKKSAGSFEQVSETDIYKMIHKNSSSVVKWILIISILEFLFWSVITVFLNDEKYHEKLQKYGMDTTMSVINGLNYLIIMGFIYVFYRNYKTISTTDSTRQLMKNILKTRKTVQNYIWFNLAMVVISVVLSIILLFYHNSKIMSLMENATSNGHEVIFILVCIVISGIFISGIICLFWLFYKLLYGKLLNKLFANYSELEKIDL